MRFSSTPESALKLEVTVLAIIETVLSVGLYIGMSLFVWESFRFLGLAILLAPLTLLRTQKSAEWGLKTFDNFWDKLEDVDGNIIVQFIQYSLAILYTLFAGPILRTIAIAYWSFAKPRTTLFAIPGNWLRQSLCIDFFHPPEILPLDASDKGADRIINFYGIKRIDYSTGNEWFDKNWRLIGIPTYMVIIYSLPLLYRITFKATSIVYLPLIWLIHSTVSAADTVKKRLERITKGELEKLRRWISLLILPFLAAKIALVQGLLDATFIIGMFPSEEIAQLFIFPDSWPIWQVMLAIDAILTICLFYFADKALADLEHGGGFSEKAIDGTIKAVTFLRGAGALAAIVFGFIWAVQLAGFSATWL